MEANADSMVLPRNLPSLLLVRSYYSVMLLGSVMLVRCNHVDQVPTVAKCCPDSGCRGWVGADLAV
jgi:hypothetical protein